MAPEDAMTAPEPRCTCPVPRPANHQPECPLWGQAEIFPAPRRARVPDMGSPPLKAPGVRRGGPQTSRDAAAVAMGSAKEQRLLILGTARGLGAHGLNASECDELQNWPAGTSGRRLGDYATAPVPEMYLVPCLERRTASGNWGRVYQAMTCAGGTCRCAGCEEGRAHVAARDAKRKAGQRRADERWRAAAGP